VPPSHARRSSVALKLALMDYGTSRLDELAATIGAGQAFVSAALDRSIQGWLLRKCHAVVGARPSAWRPKHWEYRRLTLLSVELDTSTLEGYHGGRFRAGRAGTDPAQARPGHRTGAGYEHLEVVIDDASR
jgi:hypothetical protein